MRRDKTCVVTGDVAENCDASHCLPHVKGDDYIEAITRYRGHSEDDVVTDIGDPRNGLLLWRLLHPRIGSGKSAFIRTPNFAMSTDDVPQSSPAVESRLTLQHFFEILSDITLQYAPNNKDARLPTDLSQWPPAIIVDFMYGAAALKKWGLKAGIDKLRKITEETYYSQKVRDEATHQATAAKAQESVQARATRASRRAGASGSGTAAGGPEEQEMNRNDMLDVVMGLWLQHPISGTQPPSLPRPEDVSSEKVAAWLHEQ